MAELVNSGCEITATDLSPTDDRSRSWSDSGQYLQSIDDLFFPNLCANDVVVSNVRMRRVDMSRIPEDLRQFDFVWSACALEHLGSLENGMRFVEAAMECLAPGGIAVHTTEFNLDNDDRTIHHGPTVVYRRRDFLELESRLSGQGCTMSPFSVGPEWGVFDHLIDVEPYHDGALTIRLGSHRVTSALIVVRRSEPV